MNEENEITRTDKRKSEITFNNNNFNFNTNNNLKSEINEREIECKINKSELDYRELVENANSIIFRWNTDGKITFVNQYTLSFFMYKEKEVLGKSISLFFVKRPELEKEISSMVTEIIHHPDKYVNMIHENIRSNGERVWITYTNKPLYDCRGNVTEILSIGNDITRLKLIEKELRFRVNFEKVIGNLSANLINVKINDFKRVINNCLKLVTKLSNMDRGYICVFENNGEWLKCEYEWYRKEVEKNIVKIDRIHKNDFPYFTQKKQNDIYYISDIENSGKETHVYKEISAKPGIKSIIIVPLVYEGILLGTLTFESYKKNEYWSDDIVKVLRISAIMFANAIIKKQADTLLSENENKLKMKNMELDAANERLRELDKSKSEFVSMASHELRTPLTGIIGMTQTLLAKDIDLTEEERERFLNIIESEGKRLATLLNELLDLTKIETGSTEIRLEKENLESLIEETLRIINIPKDKKIEIIIPEKCDMTIMADFDRLKQVIMNLIDNAIRYSGENGKITIGVVEKVKFYQVNVNDTGPGIGKEDQKKIFEKFYRTKSAKKSKKKGSGLGLTISKNIIEAHGGKLWVDSEPGKGSTFSFLVLKADY